MRNSLSSAVISRVIANLCAVATAFLGIRLYNLYVSKEVYGTILVGLQIIGYLPLMSGGFRMVLNQRMLAEPDAAATQSLANFGQVLQSYFFLFVTLAGVVAMAAYSQVPATHALGIPLGVFLATGVAAAINFQAGSQLALLVAFGEQVQSSLLQGAWGVLTVLILWLSFIAGAGVWAFPLSNGLGGLAAVLAARACLLWTHHDVPLFVWRRERDFWSRLKSIIWSAFDCLHNQLALLLIFTLDLIFVGLLIGPGAAAVYGIVSRIMGISRQVLQSLAEAAWPRLTQELDTDRRADMMRKVDRLNAWIVGSWFGAMAVTLLPFLGWLVKADWVASPLLAGLILARNFTLSLTSPHSYGLMSAGRFRDLARINQREAIVGIVAGIALSLLLGVNGTALAFLLATLSVTGWQLTRGYFQFAHDTHWLQEWWAVVLRGLGGATVCAALTAALWWLLLQGNTQAGLLAVPVGGVAFVVFMSAILGLWYRTGRVP